MSVENRLLPESVWVVVAAYNEAGRIGRVLDDLLCVVQSVVVVDDGSRDETAQKVLQRPVWLLEHPTNLGQGAALQTGIDFALSRGAEYLVTFDADGQHAADDIPALITTLARQGADFALGSRFLGRAEGLPWMRRLVLRLAVLFTRLTSGGSLTDTHNGLRAMTRRGAGRIRITLNRMEHASQIVDQILASGLSYVEVPVRVKYTQESLAKGQRTADAVRLGVKLLVGKMFQ